MDHFSFLVPQPIAPKPQPRGVDIDGQGTINGQSTMDFDVANALKDDEKPWKKPGLIKDNQFVYPIVFFNEF